MFSVEVDADAVKQNPEKYTLRSRRYREAEELPTLEQFPEKNRLIAGGVTLAWKSTGWRMADWDALDEVKEQMHELAFFLGREPIGRAHMKGITFVKDSGTERFWHEADAISHEWMEFATALNHAWGDLEMNANCYEKGEKFVEFTRLVMRPGYASKSYWVAPINAFIKRLFMKPRNRYMALLLKPFPLEFESEIAGDYAEARSAKCNHRLAAMKRLYARTLDVEPIEGAEDWMVRYLREG